MASEPTVNSRLLSDLALYHPETHLGQVCFLQGICHDFMGQSPKGIQSEVQKDRVSFARFVLEIFDPSL